MTALVMPDVVTILPVGDAEVHPHTRQSMGRRASTSVTVLAQIEIGRDRVTRDEIISRDADGVLVMDYPPMAPDGTEVAYTPTQGDRVLSVVHYATGIEQTVGLYLSDPKPDGAGAVYRSVLSAREPERVAL